MTSTLTPTTRTAKMADGGSGRREGNQGGDEDPDDAEGWYDDAGLFDGDDTFGPDEDDDTDHTLGPDQL
jgi:hypothetical protein